MGFAGEVLVDICMEATHQDITQAENGLLQHSAALQGKNDGWEIRHVPGAVERSEWYKMDS